MPRTILTEGRGCRKMGALKGHQRKTAFDRDIGTLEKVVMVYEAGVSGYGHQLPFSGAQKDAAVTPVTH